jgi:hypothetical protein
LEDKIMNKRQTEQITGGAESPITNQKKVATYIKKVVQKPSAIHGFDRVTLWLDHAEFPGSLDRIREHCTDIKVYSEQMRYQARCKCRIEVFQPDNECLDLIADAVGKSVSVQVSYVEIALDMIAVRIGQAGDWQDAFLGAARMRYQRQTVVLNETTFYFGRRTDANRKKRGNVQAVYADKSSKLLNVRPPNGAPKCLHIEWRSTGSGALAHFGCSTVSDLIHFDHKKFWDENIVMYEIPRPTDLGRLLAKVNGADVNVSGSALRKRTKVWREKFSINGRFILHNALLSQPGIKKSLDKVSIDDWVKSNF